MFPIDQGLATISLIPGKDAENFDGIAMVVKTDTMVADPQPKFRRLDACQLTDIPFFVGYVTGKALKYSEGGLLFNTANIRSGLGGPNKALGHGLLARRGCRWFSGHSFEVRSSKAEVGQNIFHRDRLIVLKPLASFGDGALFFRSDLFVFEGCHCQCPLCRVNHGG